MNLFKKIDYFYKKAQDSVLRPMEGYAPFTGREGGVLPSVGTPAIAIRDVAEECLKMLKSNPKVEPSVIFTYKLGEALSDLMNSRAHSNEDLNTKWAAYLTAIMKKCVQLAEEAIKDKSSEELYRFYISLYDKFSELWDSFVRVGYVTGTSKPAKPATHIKTEFDDEFKFTTEKAPTFEEFDQCVQGTVDLAEKMIRAIGKPEASKYFDAPVTESLKEEFKEFKENLKSSVYFYSEKNKKPSYDFLVKSSQILFKVLTEVLKEDAFKQLSDMVAKCQKSIKL